MNCWITGVTLMCLQPHDELIFLQNRNFEQPSNVFIMPPGTVRRVVVQDADSDCLYGNKWIAAKKQWVPCR